MSYKKSSALAIILIIILLLTNSIFVFAQPSDLEGHWAKDVMKKWGDYGVVKGTDGLFNPNSNITRAEFVTMVSRVLMPIKKSAKGFDDVAGGMWYTDDILKAVEAGFIQGDGKGSFRPLANITRQEAAVVLYNAFDMEPGNVFLLNSYKDYTEVANWAVIAVAALAEKGYMTGKPGNFLAPTDYITRAETVKLIDNIVGTLKSKAGIYTGDTSGSIVVNASGVTLKDMNIKGNLYVAHGVGEGNLTLDNVKIEGRTIVRGGGYNSIIIKNSSLSGTLVVLKKDGKVRIVLVGNSSVDDVELKGSAKLSEENLTGYGYGYVEVIPLNADAEIEIEGDIEELIIDAPNVSINVTEGTVGKLTVAPTAANTEMKIAKGAVVKDLTIEAKTEIKGTGTIEKAVVKADDVKIEQKPKETIIDLDKKAEIAGQTVIGDGKAVTDTKPPTPRPDRDRDEDPDATLTSVVLKVGETDKTAQRIDGTHFSIDLSGGGEIESIKIEPAGATLKVKSVVFEDGTEIMVNKSFDKEISVKDLLAYGKQNSEDFDMDYKYKAMLEVMTDGKDSVSVALMNTIFGNSVNVNAEISRSGYSTSHAVLLIILGD